jgi:hypothetical protein
MIQTDSRQIIDIATQAISDVSDKAKGATDTGKSLLDGVKGILPGSSTD